MARFSFQPSIKRYAFVRASPAKRLFESRSLAFGERPAKTCGLVRPTRKRLCIRLAQSVGLARMGPPGRMPCRAAMSRRRETVLRAMPNLRRCLTRRALMRSKIITFLILASSAGDASTQTAPAPVAPVAPPTTTSVKVAQQKAHAAAVASCEAMWDRGTHMTRNDWSRACRRVQNRLQQLDLR
jgi:hypothetical protein